MARGLYIDLNDGRPAMTITAGMKCPSYGGEAVEAWGQQTMTVQGYVAGATPFFIPSNSVVNVTRSPNLITTIMVLDGITNNGNGTLTQSVWSSDGWGKIKHFPAQSGRFYPQGRVETVVCLLRIRQTLLRSLMSVVLLPVFSVERSM